MKTYLYILFVFYFLSSYSQSKTDRNFSIKGTINKPTGKVYLTNFEYTKRIDSANIKDGNFHFSGSVVSPDYYHLTVNGSSYENSFFIENTTISIDIKETKESFKCDIQGGGLQKLFNSYGKISESRDLLISEIDRRFNKSTNVKEKEILTKKYDSIQKEIQKEVDVFLKRHLNSEVSPYIILLNKRDLPSLKKWYNSLDKNIKISLGGIRLNNQINRMNASIQIGDKFPEYTLPDISNKNFKISSLISGKTLTFIDFWASWCKPCREQSPYLAKIRNKYDNNSFDIVGISIDKKSISWKKAIKNDGLKWIQLIDSNKVLVNKLKINSIPSNLLIDRSGKIIAKDLKIEVLEKKIDSILKSSH